MKLLNYAGDTLILLCVALYTLVVLLFGLATLAVPVALVYYLVTH